MKNNLAQKIIFPDGSEKNMLKLAFANRIVPDEFINTFRTYVCIGKIPSAKVGSSRMVEVEIIEKWVSERRSQPNEIKLMGYA